MAKRVCQYYARIPFGHTLFLNALVSYLSAFNDLSRRCYRVITALLRLHYNSKLFHTPECERCQSKSSNGKHSNRASVTEDNTTCHYFLKSNVIKHYISWKTLFVEVNVLELNMLRLAHNTTSGLLKTEIQHTQQTLAPVLCESSHLNRASAV